jgi:hypothetical protein
VTLYAITSTVSASGDQGADPNKLVAITDTLSATTLPTSEKFTTLKTARYGEVLRGVSFTPSPTLNGVSASIHWGDNTPDTPGTVSLSGNTYTVTGSHTYKEEGSYPITTTISQLGFTQTFTKTVNSTATVAEAQLSAEGQNIAGLEGASTLPVTVATFTDLGGPEVTTDYSATIDWGGAGTGSTVGTIVPNSDGSFSVQGSFTYAKEGDYTVKVHIVHEHGISADTTSTATIKDNLGILLLDASGKGALNASGNASVTVTGGGAIVVDSSNSQALTASGNAFVNAADIDTRGTLQTGNAFVGPIDNNEPPVTDPLASLSAPPVPTIVRSTGTLNISKGLVTLEPGLYIGGIKISGNAHVVLMPGLYYFQGGGFTVSGNATVTDNGQGVMLYNAPAKTSDGITISGNANVSLSGLSAAQLADLGLTGPQFADYVGLAIFQDRTSSAALTVGGHGSLSITGTVYAASAAVQISGNGSVSLEGSAMKKFGSHLLVADLTVSGNASITVDASDNNLQLL